MSSSSGLFFHSLTCLYLWPKCRTLQFALYFIRLAQAHLSSLPRSLWMIALPSSMSTIPHSLSANLLKIHSVPLSVLLTEMLNSTVCWPWGISRSCPSLLYVAEVTFSLQTCLSDLQQDSKNSHTKIQTYKCPHVKCKISSGKDN